MGKSGRAMLEALIAGETNPAKLAGLADRRVKASPEELREALRGRVTKHHRFLLRLHLNQIDALDAAMATLDAQVEANLGPFHTAVELVTSVSASAGEHRPDHEDGESNHHPILEAHPLRGDRRADASLTLVLNQGQSVAKEVKRVLTMATSLKARAMLTLAYGCGLRASEVVRLRAGDIDSEQMIIRIVQSKGRKDRHVMLPAELLELLRQWWKARAWRFLNAGKQAERADCLVVAGVQKSSTEGDMPSLGLTSMSRQPTRLIPRPTSKA
jgi:hypothetical protein